MPIPIWYETMPIRTIIYVLGTVPEEVIEDFMKSGAAEARLILVSARGSNYEIHAEIVGKINNLLSYAGLGAAKQVTLNPEEGFENTALEFLGQLANYVNAGPVEFHLFEGCDVTTGLSAVFIARALALLGYPVKIYVKGNELPLYLFTSPISMTKPQIEVLSTLCALGAARVEALAVGRAADTARKLLEKMMKKGLVKKRTEGKVNIYEPTILGRLVCIFSRR